MDGKNPSPSPAISVRNDLQTPDGERMPSNPDLFAPSKEPASKPEFSAAKRELTPFEFLELLRKQEPDKIQFSSALGAAAADGNCSHTSSRIQSAYKNKQDDKSIAIDEYGIASAVDYGSRDDYYPPSSHTSDVPYKRKEKEFDELHKTYTDTRGNWWEGSFNY